MGADSGIYRVKLGSSIPLSGPAYSWSGRLLSAMVLVAADPWPGGPGASSSSSTAGDARLCAIRDCNVTSTTDGGMWWEKSSSSAGPELRGSCCLCCDRAWKLHFRSEVPSKKLLVEKCRASSDFNDLFVRCFQAWRQQRVDGAHKAREGGRRG